MPQYRTGSAGFKWRSYLAERQAVRGGACSHQKMAALQCPDLVVARSDGGSMRSQVRDVIFSTAEATPALATGSSCSCTVMTSGCRNVRNNACIAELPGYHISSWSFPLFELLLCSSVHSQSGSSFWSADSACRASNFVVRDSDAAWVLYLRPTLSDKVSCCVEAGHLRRCAGRAAGRAAANSFGGSALGRLQTDASDVFLRPLAPCMRGHEAAVPPRVP
jgi:hypothetical protein